ncbi:alpha/beta hydrolase [Streptomyces triculaminicus]|uniref:Alpha/beta hydrolase n=1 Tax=Streptomyces triculaminicus TaxID=2816232 RepID=A0A939FLK5_9ACTN|nr:alpha/beta hydrolase [Streptomyces triculaminicus]MBO0652222.1 alpha/beta hydrolase [Streptomyces triculaminicus]
MTSEREEEALFGLPYVPPDETVAYGPHPSQVVDFYGPPGAATRITLLHGGFWREAYDRRHLAPLAAALAGEGLRVALAEYRRVGGGGGWPATFDDAARAVGTGGTGRAPARHVVAGHSAGGHLALWLASGPTAAQLDGVVALAPVADLARARALRLSDGAVAGLVGPADEAQADPMRLPPPAVPVTLLHGDDDREVPVAFSAAYAAYAPAVAFRPLAGTGHYAPVTPGTPAYGALLAAIVG